MQAITMMRKTFIFAIISAFLTVSLQVPALAAMVDNQNLALELQLQAQRDDVRSFMARDDVRGLLLEYGVSSANVDKRIANMTGSELQQLQSQFAQLPAGGNGVLGAILMVILIFVVLDVLGATDVFPRI